MSDEFETLESEIASLSGRNMALESLLKIHIDSGNKLCQRIASLEDENEKLTIDCVNLVGENRESKKLEQAYDERIAALEAELTTLREQNRQYAKQELLNFMSWFSEETWCAGWISGLERICKGIVSGEYDYGEKIKNRLTELHEAAGGWWEWSDELMNEIFVPDKPEVQE